MWFLLLILPFALGSIRIDLITEYDEDSINSDIIAYLSGNTASIITDHERNIFDLKDDTIKEAIGIHYGSRPDQVYVRSPTPWDDLYKIYKWKQVTRTTVPHNARLASMTDDNVVLLQETFENNSTKVIEVNVGLSKEVVNSISSSWSQIGDSTTENIKIKFSSEVNGSKYDYNHVFGWGVYGVASISEVLGSTPEVKMILHPGQSVIAVLEARKGTAIIEMEYEASLSGSVAANYKEIYKGHHFYNFNIADILKAKDLRETSKSIQTLEIISYYGSKVVVKDKKGKKLMSKKFSRVSTRSGNKRKSATKYMGEAKTFVDDDDDKPEGKRIVLSMPKDVSNDYANKTL